MQVNLKYMLSLAKHIAPKNDIRSYLNGVLVECDGNAIYYVATDGHKMAIMRQGIAESDAIAGQFIIPRAVLAAMKLQKVNRNTVEYAELVLNGTKATLIYCGTETTFYLIDGTFPQWRRVIPATVSNETAQFDPDLLVSLRDCCNEALGAKNPCLYLAHNGESPALYQSSSNDFIGIVMPIRCKREDAWIPDADSLHRLYGFSEPLKAAEAA